MSDDREEPKPVPNRADRRRKKKKVERPPWVQATYNVNKINTIVHVTSGR